MPRLIPHACLAAGLGTLLVIGLTGCGQSAPETPVRSEEQRKEMIKKDIEQIKRERQQVEKQRQPAKP
ncbi:MAG: hypothetical protein U0736_16820 [Gemmataceae bacterium]